MWAYKTIFLWGFKAYCYWINIPKLYISRFAIEYMNEKDCVIKVKKIARGAELPSYAYKSDAGFDLRANETVELLPGEQKVVRTGLIFEIPKEYVGLVRDRAGIVEKMGVHTAAGTFDPDFRGEVSILMVNLADETARIEKGMKIAQMIIIPFAKPKIIEVKKLSDTERGEKSFGSTDLKKILKEK